MFDFARKRLTDYQLGTLLERSLDCGCTACICAQTLEGSAARGVVFIPAVDPQTGQPYALCSLCSDGVHDRLLRGSYTP